MDLVVLSMAQPAAPAGGVRSAAAVDGAWPAAPAGGARRLRASVLAAAGLHAGVLLLLCVGMAQRDLRAPAAPAVLTLVYGPATQEAAELPARAVSSRALAETTLPVPVALAPVLRPMQLRAKAGAARPLAVAARPVAAPAAVSGAAAGAITASEHAIAPVTQAADAAAAHDDTLRLLGAWEARIRQAVQDAVLYPGSARLLRREGRVQVQFDYDQGVVARTAVLQSSRTDALDHAAMAAVTRAAMPAAPPGLGGERRTLVVWVDFHLAAQD